MTLQPHGYDAQALNPTGQGLGGVVNGATYPFRAIAFLRRYPQLLQYVLFPILVNLIVGGTLYVGLINAGFDGIDGMMASLPNWAMVLEGVLRVLLAIMLFLLTGLLLLQFGVILGSPWYGKLSEEMEVLRTGCKPEDVPSIGGVVRDLWRAIAFELKKLLLTLVVGLPLFVAGFLPGLGTTVATVGSIALGITIACLDFFDPALERRRLRFRQKLGIIWRCFPASGSFGLICLGLISVPLLNLLAIPVCITAGTLFFCDRILAKSPKPMDGES
jgi:CysZ protein